jgi:hypothetical protein
VPAVVGPRGAGLVCWQFCEGSAVQRVCICGQRASSPLKIVRIAVQLPGETARGVRIKAGQHVSELVGCKSGHVHKARPRRPHGQMQIPLVGEFKFSDAANSGDP